ncbi:DUF1837 domain-containing protein [Enterococcus hirae]|uniref:HamA C-terminal domain-containing protein n=1 Tax=Enterococcus hirae TaxID=1354 RepID=UPI001A963AF6|nr:DUF1837 domain-containing protein [Enterococcus hirae]EMF0150498.1 DUF1837 domain-containing protein [Enterococcus hirae]EMF0244157.1 DUF1837 domain-containing protein [Enterococcus hirae]EMF0427041.1 DUF1837 domain-containing protein [Enterococcus hirae]EMF0531587.1 DUF1837 domain-containing protein [Enterococcus hirae]MBO1100088.1 DUF1837 domain-containing protein [Enterococcus hirae]
MPIETNPFSKNFLEVLQHSKTYKVNNATNNLELFTCQINANKFNYSQMVESLLEAVAYFSISRKKLSEYQSSPMKLSQRAREKFKNYKKNKGELGEFLLFCFLEGHLGAPKVLSKLELKTATNMYVNGSDGIHFLRLPNGDYQLIFGESKVYADLTDGLRDAFHSVRDFINETSGSGEKSGINYEKHLISSNIFNETWSPEEEAFIEGLIYPSTDNSFNVDDAFGIFIGFEINITDEQKKLSNSEFRVAINKQINDIVTKKIKNIEKYISENELFGYTFHVYTMPFTDIDKTREIILENLIK